MKPQKRVKRPNIAVFDAAVFLSYNGETDRTSFKCYNCGHIDSCPGNPQETEVHCKKCEAGLLIFHHDPWASSVRDAERRKRRLAEEIIPFIASLISALIVTFSGIVSFNFLQILALTIIGGVCFRVAYVVIRSIGSRRINI